MATKTLLQIRICELINKHGSLRNAALILQIDPGYLYRLQVGLKTEPGWQLLRRLKLRRIVTYESL